ncbi:VOC family protein [Variovorax sp. CCNWLW186]|uniref:VOC family protein n=1 Tax=Variovorax sp. CCNWLW186 TaxID=3127473 RepID=UPI003FD11333
MLKQPRLVIAVRDLARSADFYSDVLGFSIEWKEVPGWRLFRRDACTIMAGECPDTPAARELGEHSYMAYIEVDDVTGLHKDLCRWSRLFAQSPGACESLESRPLTVTA